MKPVSSGTPFVAHVRVRYADTDTEGVVYYGSYLTYFEVVRVELLRALGCPVGTARARGVVFPAVAVQCRYHRPAFVDDPLDVCLWLESCGRASFGFQYEVRREEDLLTSGSSRHAFVDLETGRPSRKPDWFAELWARAAACQRDGSWPALDGQPDGAYTVIWRYKVASHQSGAFEAAYGPDGDWARFFSAADGYKETRLLRDQSAAGGYIVADVWTSAAAYDRFLQQNRAEYSRRSLETGTLYETEERLGGFESPAALSKELQ